MTLPTLDTHEFTRRGDVAEGSLPLGPLERLGPMLCSQEGAIAWRLSGRSELGPDGSRRPFLRLALDGAVRMRCVRCLEPVAVPLKVERDYRLVATEAQAEREDADEEDVDLLVSSRRFDLAALLEDEAIMALPLAPRHEACNAPAIAPPARGASVPDDADGADDGAVAPRDEGAPPVRTPFAALAGLRTGSTGAPGEAGGGPDGGPDGGGPDGGGPDGAQPSRPPARRR